MARTRREVPTVFVRGPADPGSVRAVEDALAEALTAIGADVDLSYCVLWIETDAPRDVVVEIELGVPGGTVGARAVGATMHDAAMASIARVTADLTRVSHS
jgi:hypothetical protein